VASQSEGTQSVLEDVSAVGKDVAWAVGSWSEGSTTHTLIERWDGAFWAIVPSPNVPGSDVNELVAVDALSSTDAWAVGTAYPDAYDTPLVEHWDGSTWDVVELPVGYETDLEDVHALSADDVWVVGHWIGDDDFEFPFTAHWDGAAWTVVTAPLGDLGPTVLTGVSGAAPDDVWAVGFDYVHIDLTPVQPVAEHWDGTAWTVVPTPTPGTDDDTLRKVDALGTDDAWAVGNSLAGSFALRWDGSAWHLSRVSREVSTLEDVVATSPNVTWTVGSRTGANGLPRAESLLRTRHGWRSLGGPGSDFRGIAAVSPSRLLAVGNDGVDTSISQFVRCP
jgi:hypothetical protein